VHQPNPERWYRLLTAGCHGGPIRLKARPGDHRPFESSRSLRHDRAETAGKSKQDEHTAATNLGETPENRKIYT
jgi:hypothetical protein